MSETNKQIIVTELPDGHLEERHFALKEVPIPEAGDGEVLTRTLLLSLDAANRAWMQGATYTAPVLAGDIMHGMTISQVVESKDPAFAPGDIVECQSGWQEYASLPPKAMAKLEVRGPLSQHMSILGITGLTAYFGLLEVGAPKEGETLVVSAAAGAVGNVVGQIGKIKGCRVVGIAGTDEKCEWLRELGFDAAINYKREDLAQGLRAACPDGIDVYFDNVAGDTLQAALLQMRLHGRIVCCGAVSQYDKAERAPSPMGLPGLLIVRRLTMQGFIVMDHYDRRQEAERELLQWVQEGHIQYRLDIVDGLKQAPRALIGVLYGDNTGKRMIRVDPDS